MLSAKQTYNAENLLIYGFAETLTKNVTSIGGSLDTYLGE